MNIAPNDLQDLRHALDGAKEILLLTVAKPTIDSLASGLALYLTLSQLGKRVTIACPEKVTVGAGNLVGIDKVNSSLGNKNFVISLDYVEGSIEKVSYNIEGDRFNLVIEPRPSFLFSEDKVQYRQSGSNADLILTIGATRLEEFGVFVSDIKNLSNATLINIDNHASNTRFAKLNLVYPGMGSLSEVVVFLMLQLGLPIDVDSATNLLDGITDATVNFSSTQTTPDSFEAAAILLRAGAQKRTPIHTQASDYSTVTMGQSGLSQRTATGVPPVQSFAPSYQPTQSQVPEQPLTNATNDEAPPDWLKPKIFRSKRQNINSSSNYTPSEGGASRS